MTVPYLPYLLGRVDEFTWDHHNRLTKFERYVAAPGGAVQREYAPDPWITVRTDATPLPSVDYGYDVFDQLIVREDAKTTVYVNERGHRLIEFWDYGGAEPSIKRRLYGPGVDQLLAVDGSQGTNATKLVWTLHDHQGTVRTLVGRDSEGDLETQPITYDTFGDPGLSPGSLGTQITTFYAGRDYDNTTGLYYNRARWYDPVGQRFIGVDPIGLRGGDTNLYRYCFNSPTNATDPSGNIIFGGVGLALVIGGTLVGLGGVGAAHHGANEMQAATAGEYDDARFQNGAAWFQGGVITTGVGGGFVAAPLMIGAGSGLATYAGIGAAEGAVSGAFVGGATSYGMGGDAGEVGWATLEGGVVGGVTGGVTGGALHLAGRGIGLAAQHAARSLVTKSGAIRSPALYQRLLKSGLTGKMSPRGLLRGPNRGTGVLRDPARSLLKNEDVLIDAKHGLQSRTTSRFDDVTTGSHGAPESKYLWTIDERGLNVALEKTPFPTPRGNIVHTNLSRRASIGGEAWFESTDTVVINAGSGRFGDAAGITPKQWAAGIRYWEDLGYKVKSIPFGSR